MYSESVTAKQCEKIEASLGIKLHRYSHDESRNLSAYMKQLRDAGKLFNSNGSIAKKEHAAFIRN